MGLNFKKSVGYLHRLLFASYNYETFLDETESPISKDDWRVLLFDNNF
jgi:hypothetical protein